IIYILINFFIIIIFCILFIIMSIIRGGENVIIAKLFIKDLEVMLSFSLFLVLLLILLLKVFYWFR
ncbi:hypothetical protein, partial [Helicobacter sp. UBA3407]|uniref:hypothetical protein n=1 Tax=Helicobacter sp. UBA3407 TaxID=1946588 RepID=UPI002627042B